jgi:hypothetical protein
MLARLLWLYVVSVCFFADLVFGPDSYPVKKRDWRLYLNRLKRTPE